MRCHQEVDGYTCNRPKPCVMHDQQEMFTMNRDGSEDEGDVGGNLGAPSEPVVRGTKKQDPIAALREVQRLEKRCAELEVENTELKKRIAHAISIIGDLEQRVGELPREFGRLPLLGESTHDPRFRYRDWIEWIFMKDAEIVARKDPEYGGSWMKRGGRGAWANLCRKWDRIETQVLVHDEDLFKLLRLDRRPDGILDDVGDLRRYLAIVEGWAHAEAEAGR